MKQSVMAVLSIGLACGAASANMVKNGDFENHSYLSTQFNLSNAGFTANVDFATAFGGSEELDVVTGTDFGISPVSGKWKVGLHQRPDNPANVDAFSLELSWAVMTGGAYTLSFYTAGNSSSTAPRGPIEIGLSSSPSSFGTLIFSGTAESNTAWTQFMHHFVSPVDATYLTIRNSTTPGNMYAFVDDVSLVPAPGVVGALAFAAGMAATRRRR